MVEKNSTGNDTLSYHWSGTSALWRGTSWGGEWLIHQDECRERHPILLLMRHMCIVREKDIRRWVTWQFREEYGKWDPIAFKKWTGALHKGKSIDCKWLNLFEDDAHVCIFWVHACSCHVECWINRQRDLQVSDTSCVCICRALCRRGVAATLSDWKISTNYTHVCMSREQCRVESQYTVTDMISQTISSYVSLEEHVELEVTRRGAVDNSAGNLLIFFPMYLCLDHRVEGKVKR